MWRNSPALLLLALAACDDAAITNRTARAGEVKVQIPDAEDANASRPLKGVGAPMAWRVVGGAAFYGAADAPPAFALRCDPAARQIVFERAGGGAAITLAAGSSAVSLGARSVGGGGRVQARTGLGDAVLDAMARSQSQVTVGGGAEPVIVPGGVAVRRVLDLCRNPPAPAPAATPGPVEAPETIDEPAAEPF